MYYLEFIAATGLEVGLRIQINELLKFNEYQRSMSLFDFAKCHSEFKIKTCFLGNC